MDPSDDAAREVTERLRKDAHGKQANQWMDDRSIRLQLQLPKLPEERRDIYTPPRLKGHKTLRRCKGCSLWCELYTRLRRSLARATSPPITIVHKLRWLLNSSTWFSGSRGVELTQKIAQPNYRVALGHRTILH